MFEVLDRQTTLTGNKKKILAAAIIGDALEFFDFFLIAFVFAFLIGPWKLTFGQTAVSNSSLDSTRPGLLARYRRNSNVLGRRTISSVPAKRQPRW